MQTYGTEINYEICTLPDGYGAGIGYAIGGDWQSALIGGIAGGVVGGISFNQSRDFFNVGVRSQNSTLKLEPSKVVAGVGDFLQAVDLFPKALSFSKAALSSIARRQAEEYFVRKNFDNPEFIKLRKYYSRFEDTMGTKYFGFTEQGFTNVNQYLGNDPGPYRGVDLESNLQVSISRVFPKVALNVTSVTKLKWITGYGFNDSKILEGWGYELSGMDKTSNAASVTVAFQTKQAAVKFYDTHYTTSFNQQVAAMQKYYKVHK